MTDRRTDGNPVAYTSLFTEVSCENRIAFGISYHIALYLHENVTSSSAVAERPRDALYPLVVSFDTVIPRAEYRLQIYHCVQLNAVLLSST